MRNRLKRLISQVVDSPVILTTWGELSGDDEENQATRKQRVCHTRDSCPRLPFALISRIIPPNIAEYQLTLSFIERQNFLV